MHVVLVEILGAKSRCSFSILELTASARVLIAEPIISSIRCLSYALSISHIMIKSIIEYMACCSQFCSSSIEDVDLVIDLLILCVRIFIFIK